MANSSSTAPGHAADDAQLWQSLKSAIATSSGFQSWRSERSSSIKANTSTEQMIRLYLRETLETLAY
ncbi:MAG: hypothetical protein AAGL08_10800 [Cyanobacteria bacterium J06573_11]